MNLVGAADHLARASRHTELLVIGTRGRSDFPELLSHGVAANCLRRAGCPVVVIPPTAIR
jgi:nucleotide-binding universal stress UspA family protein